MTLDELQTKWQEHDQKLDAAIRLNRELLNERSLSGAHAALRRQIVLSVAGAVTCWIPVPLMGVFLAFNHSSAQFVVPAMLTALFFSVNMLVHIGQARALSKIDYGKPITLIQKQISAVVKVRIRFAQWLAMSTVLSWVPISIVLFKGLFGWDLYALAPRWLIANSLIGLACIPLVIWLSRRRNATQGESQSKQRFVRDIAGHNIAAANAFLETLTDFERDDSQSSRKKIPHREAM
jgi:hypothetical protein